MYAGIFKDALASVKNCANKFFKFFSIFRISPSTFQTVHQHSKGIFWYFAVLFCWILRKWFLRAVQISPSCTLVKYVISPSKILFRNSTKVWNLKTKISEVSKIWRRTKSKLIEQDLMESSWTIQWRIELRNVILFRPNSEYEKWIFWTIFRGINYWKKWIFCEKVVIL